MKKSNRKKGKKKVVAFTVCGIAAAAVGGMALYGSAAAKNEPSVKQETITLEKMDISQKVTVSGTVQSAEKLSLTSEIVNTKVKSVKVKVGDKVKKGDVIAELDDTDLKAQLDTAKKAIDNSKQISDINLNAAQRGYEDAIEDFNAKSASGARSVNVAQDTYNKAVDDQNKTYNDYNEAVNDRVQKENAAAEAATASEEAAETVEDLTANLKKLKAAYDAASDAYDKVAANRDADASALNDAKYERDTAKNCLELGQQALDEATEKSKAADKAAAQCAEAYSAALMKEKELKAGLTTVDRMVDDTWNAVQSASDAKRDAEHQYGSMVSDRQDAVDTAKLSTDGETDKNDKQIKDIEESIEKCVIRAEFDGVVTAVGVKEGETYAGGQIAEIQDDSSYKVEAKVDQYDISKLNKDMPAEISVQALGSESIDGKLSFVSPTPAPAVPTADGTISSSTDYVVEASFGDKTDGLRIGMSAKLIVVTEEKQNVFAVPDNCILSDDDGWYVQVSKDGAEIENVYVEKGLKTDYYTEISGKDIKEGMNVIQPESEDKPISLFY